MKDIDLAFQKALRARLIASDSVTGLVPAANILDTNQRPAPVPSIILGDSQLVDEGSSLKRTHWRLYHTLHVWKREPSLTGAKAISGAAAAAMRDRLDLGDGLHCADLRVSGIRTMRDPDGEHSHGLVTIEALIAEVAP